MEEKNRVLGKIFSADVNLLNFRESPFSVRHRDSSEITLFSLSGKMLRLLSKKIGDAPNSVVCEKLPDLKVELAEDGWTVEDGILRIPYLTKIELKKVKQYNPVENLEIGDFPGHMQNLIVRRMRQDDFASTKLLGERLNQLSLAIREHLTESAEIPLIEVVSFGEGTLSSGDAALCGMLLTGRCFAIGGRFKVPWHNRLSMEVRRLLHRTDNRGKNWLGFALEGSLTETQKKFFNAMAKDFECADEIVVKDIANEESFNGKAFLMGVSTALEMLKKGVFQD